VPTSGETGETTVKTLTLVHGKKVNLKGHERGQPCCNAHELYRELHRAPPGR
jgi:hypothetical protein